MSLDLVAVAKRCSVWSGDAVIIAAATTRLHKAYFQLEPSIRASLMADEQAAGSAWLALGASFHAYDSTSKLSKVSAALAIFDTVAKTTPLLTRIATDGKSLFDADWPVVQPDVDLILYTLQGKPA